MTEVLSALHSCKSHTVSKKKKTKKNFKSKLPFSLQLYKRNEIHGWQKWQIH